MAEKTRETEPLTKKRTVKTRNASWVATYLNTSPQTVGRLIEEGKLKAFRLTERGPWFVLMDSVDQYLQAIKTRYGIE